MTDPATTLLALIAVGFLGSICVAAGIDDYRARVHAARFGRIPTRHTWAPVRTGPGTVHSGRVDPSPTPRNHHA